MNTVAPDPRRWKALALLCGAFFMVILDATIVLVALPSIGADLGFSAQGLQWVLSAYALTFGGLLLLGGRAADLLGRRRLFMTGVVFFTAASLMCGLAWSPAALLAARVVQGVGAAIMTTTALSIISTTFPEGAERNKALGIWGALGGIGATAAWLIGGPLDRCSPGIDPRNGLDASLLPRRPTTRYPIRGAVTTLIALVMPPTSSSCATSSNAASLSC
jgi:MFS family permease